jgi:hypothetical protein
VSDAMKDENKCKCDSHGRLQLDQSPTRYHLQYGGSVGCLSEKS